MQESLDLSGIGSEEDLSGYDYPAEGQFHLVVHEVDASREKGNAVYVGFTVLAGNIDGQVNKRFNERFADPDPDQKDGGKFCRRRQAKLLLACGVLSKDQLGQANVAFDWDDLLWKQLKGAVKNYERSVKDDRTGDVKVYHGAQLDGMDFWGPLDDAAKHIPQDDEAIAMARDAGQANVVNVPISAPASAQAASKSQPASASASGQTAAKPQSLKEQMASGRTAASKPPAADPYANL